jgi:hypothetical protein
LELKSSRSEALRLLQCRTEFAPAKAALRT